MIKYWYFMV